MTATETTMATIRFTSSGGNRRWMQDMMLVSGGVNTIPGTRMTQTRGASRRGKCGPGRRPGGDCLAGCHQGAPKAKLEMSTWHRR